MTRAELLSRMSSSELSEWQAFSLIEPFGGDADYLGHAITAVTVANRQRGKNEKPHKVSDFLPKFEPKTQTVEEMRQYAEMMTVALGGEVHKEE